MQTNIKHEDWIDVVWIAEKKFWPHISWDYDFEIQERWTRKSWKYYSVKLVWEYKMKKISKKALESYW